MSPQLMKQIRGGKKPHSVLSERCIQTSLALGKGTNFICFITAKIFIMPSSVLPVAFISSPWAQIWLEIYIYLSARCLTLIYAFQLSPKPLSTDQYYWQAKRIDSWAIAIAKITSRNLADRWSPLTGEYFPKQKLDPRQSSKKFVIFRISIIKFIDLLYLFAELNWRHYIFFPESLFSLFKWAIMLEESYSTFRINSQIFFISSHYFSLSSDLLDTKQYTLLWVSENNELK